jgi:hypothetical protein
MQITGLAAGLDLPPISFSIHPTREPCEILLQPKLDFSLPESETNFSVLFFLSISHILYSLGFQDYGSYAAH